MRLCKTALVVATTWILLACGGGSDSTSDIAPTANVTTTISQGASQLRVDEQFTVATDIELLIDIKPAVIEPNSYLIVCHYDLHTSSIDRQKCVFQGELTTKGVYEVISVAHKETQLVAEVWLFVENYNPEQFHWALEPSALEQQFIVR